MSCQPLLFAVLFLSTLFDGKILQTKTSLTVQNLHLRITLLKITSDLWRKRRKEKNKVTDPLSHWILQWCCCLRDDNKLLSVFESSFSSTPAKHLYGHHVVVQNQIRGPSIKLITVCASSPHGSLLRKNQVKSTIGTSKINYIYILCLYRGKTTC